MNLFWEKCLEKLKTSGMDLDLQEKPRTLRLNVENEKDDTCIFEAPAKR